MKRVYFLIMLSVPMWALEALGQVASASPSASPLAGVNNAISNLTNHIPGSLPTWIVGGIVVVAELIARRWPTAQPMSLFIAVSQVFKGLSALSLKLSALLDQLVGQSLKKDA